MKHVWQSITAGPGRLVNDHYFRAVDSGNWRGCRLAITLNKVTHELPLQLVHDVICNLAAVIVSLVDDRAFFILLRVIIASEVCVPRAGRVRKPDISQLPPGKLVNQPAIVFDPRAR